MVKKDICIVIPIYKEILNGYEILSVRQCIKVLEDYTIIFVCSDVLNVEFYKKKFTEINKYFVFENDYFNDITGYNRLMLSAFFYKAFCRYKYMLIYQTDCFVFRDELLYWSNKGYDYIGGIWFEGFVGNPDAGAKYWYAGNGGFSLRNIKSMTRFLSSKKPLKSFKQLISEKIYLFKKEKFNGIKGLLLLFPNFIGYKNNCSFYAKKYCGNEDVFIELYSKYFELKIPDVSKALIFSWDRCPDFLYKKIGQLPFGCHAWYRDDFPYEQNNEFWSKFIKDY